MKIRIISDLHVDYDWWFPTPMDDENTTLVIAGDVCPLYKRNLIVDYLTDLSYRFERVIMVPGNHEYDGSPVNTELDKFKAELDLDNVHILENEVLRIGACHFIGATMWTDFDKGRLLNSSDQYRDYHRNLFEEDGKLRLVNPQDIYDIHLKSKKFIFGAIDNVMLHEGEEAIVITHHTPSFQSLDDRYKKDPWDFNGHFHNDFDNLLIPCPCTWIHGHTHSSHDYCLGTSRVICNPKGYMNENPDFDETLVIEL